ncbi:hypothetical protein JTE90_026886 [Oedothorax gibbosus]|uniref:Uncharacterized protein n=1 Tax=Oedothorax gibbosus TaxID=931172 RepID=A0AAV6TPT1_9ARAC|nr:hypothetical protein JTE90_026886 [Oedothorax gibbosus]
MWNSPAHRVLPELAQEKKMSDSDSSRDVFATPPPPDVPTFEEVLRNLTDNDHLRLTFFIEKQPYYLWTLKAMLETMAANPRTPLLPFPYNPNDDARAGDLAQQAPQEQRAEENTSSSEGGNDDLVVENVHRPMDWTQGLPESIRDSNLIAHDGRQRRNQKKRRNQRERRQSTAQQPLEVNVTILQDVPIQRVAVEASTAVKVENFEEEIIEEVIGV